MIVALWVRRLIRSQLWRTLGAAFGIALAAALLGSLGAFLASSSSVMTQRAIAGVPVDWQVQIAPGAAPADVLKAVGAVALPSAAEEVEYADVAGFSAQSSGTVQTTASGVVVGLRRSYRHAFPMMIRTLIGEPDGVLLSQQTAANLHARVGDTVEIVLSGAPPVTARIDGVVDLPFADSFFQTIGAAVAQPAPPDNVLIVPDLTWQRWFASQRRNSPRSVRTQLHVRITHVLPSDPVQALTAVTTMARDVELKTAGAAAIGDNLAAQLSSTREDAYYARILFLFLGLPGALLAAFLALAVVGSGDERRRREAALLRLRGAAAATVRGLAVVDAVVVAVLGSIGALASTLAAILLFEGPLGLSGSANAGPLAWAAIACVALAVLVIISCVSGIASVGSNVDDRKTRDSQTVPLWRRLYFDWLLLAISALAFWKIAAAGYQIVVAPEGVLEASVSYDAFFAPLCLWLGATLLARRLAEAFLARRSGLLRRMLAPVTGSLSGAIAAVLARQRVTLGRGVTMLGLSLSFAISTATFDTTYNAQSRVDAELTNGADVTVTIPKSTSANALARRIERLSGVAAVDVIEHRFAYVGADLQDFYGIDPATLGRATHLSDAYFAKHDAKSALAALSARRDGVFVSEETVKDFQLREGDTLRLRLQGGGSGTYRAVPFTFAGVVREFPTAPKDSFIVANERYVDAVTGTTGPPTILIRTSGDPSRVAAAVSTLALGTPGARVTDINEAVTSVGSSLTSVDLRALSTLELVFAILLSAAAACLTLALGFAERRRSHAILTALGASPRQLAAFLWSEGLIVLIGGAVLGIALGFGVAAMLVKVLTGVFDPPPEALNVPWLYVIALFVTVVSATIITVAVSANAARREPVPELRKA